MAQRKKASMKPKASPRPKIRPSYILIVEDEPTQAAVIRRTIRAANPNVKVKVIGSLREYRSAIASSLPDIVLMDINLTDGKAFEVLTSPLETGPFPIVVMTGYGNEKIAVKAMKYGALDYIVKSPEAFKAIPRTLERASREWKLIQDRKRSEEALRESELRFYTLYENVTVGLYRTTPAGKILMANQALVQMLGYSSFEKLAERNLSKVGFEKTTQRKAFLRKIEMEGEVNNFESVWIRLDGSLLIVQESARAIRDSQGKTLYYDGAVEDVTQRRLAEVAGRHAEDALRESEEKFRSIAENFHDVLFITDTKGIITYISPSVDHVFGYKSEDMKGRFFGEYLDEVELPRIRPVFERAIRTGIPTKNLSVRAKRRDGKIFYAELDTSIIEKNGKVQGTTGVIRDISERKRAEETIRESEDIFRNFMEHSPIYVFFKDENIRAIRLSKNYEAMLGKPVAELLGKNMNDLFPSELAMSIVADDKRIMKEGKEITIEEELNGRYYSTVKFPIFIEGKTRYLAGFTIDITERKQAEKALSASEEKYRLLFENNPVPMWVFDVNSLAFLAVNDFAIDHYGYSREEFLSMTIKDIRPPEDIPYLQEVLKKHTKQMRKVGAERHRRKDGSLIDVEITGHEIEFEGHRAMFVLAMDITERKRAEEALRNSEEKFRKAFITSPDSININRLNDGVYVSINQGLTRLMGYTEEDILGKTSIEKNIWVDLSDRNKLLEGLKTHGVVENLVARFRSKTGEIKYGMMSASIIVLDGIQHILSITRDITERKQAEEALRESEARLKRAQQCGHLGSWSWNIKTNHLEWSDEMFHLFGIEKEKFSGTLSEVIAQAIHPDDRNKVEQSNLSVIDNRKPVPLEYRIIWPDQSIHTVWAEAGELILDTAGNPFFLNGIVQDITERKQAEEARFEALARFSGFAEASQYGMGMADMDGTILFANTTLIHLLGEQSMDDCQGKKFPAAYYTPSMARRIQEEVFPVLMQDGHWQGELELLATDGRRIPTYENFFVIRDEHGKPRYIADILTDITERKKVEEALREIEERYRLISENTADVIWTMNVKTGKFTYVSDSIQKLRGYTPDEIMNQTMADALTPESLERVTQIFQEGMTKRKPGDTSQQKSISLVDQPCKDGSVVSTEVVTSIVFNEQGEPIEIIGVSRDITERKLVEEKIREKDIQFRKLSSNVPDLIFQFTRRPDGTYFVPIASEGIKNIFGCSPEDVLEDFAPISRAIFPEDAARVMSDIEYSATHLTFFTCEFRVQIPGKAIQWIYSRSTPEQLADGSITWFGFNTDITESKRAEEALRESEERMRAIVEGTPHLFFYTQDAEANTTYVSPTVEQITGYKADIWLKKKDWFVTAAKFNQDAKEKTLAHLRGEISHKPMLFEVCHANGNSIFLEAYEYPILQNGKVIGLQGVVHDITERRQAEETLRQMQKLEGLGTLAGGIAHDFNNILGIILAYNAIIKRHKDDAKQLDLATDTITKAVDRGTTLVSQILTFARRSGTEFGPVNVTEVVMEIVTMIIETFPKVLTYSQNFDKDIPLISADRSQLHQALLNLCVNARDAMPNGGVLTINIRMVSGTRLHKSPPDTLESMYVCIEVIDTGEGMTDETRKRIFEPFFTTKEKGKGTGLGLAVVFGIVQTHKGFIEVESEPGKGTIFRMYIPASEAAVPLTIEVGETIEELPGGKETLLVVEDELNLRIPLLKILSEKGYRVLSADNGLEGAKIYEERNKDIALVITDLGLPKMSGMDLCKRIKQFNPSARIVVATGYIAPEIKLEFQKAGIQNILFKPYNAKKVLKVIRKFLDEK